MIKNNLRFFLFLIIILFSSLLSFPLKSSANSIPTISTSMYLSNGQPMEMMIAFDSLFGAIIDTGGVNPTVRGFQYGPTTNYGITTIENGSFAADGYFQSGVISCGNAYHYRAYATNSVGTGYSDDSMIYTEECPPEPGPHAANVSISGNPNFLQTLTGHYDYTNIDDGINEGVSTFRWLRDGVAINGATSLTYTIISADIGHALQFEVTPVASAGEPLVGTPVVSSSVDVVDIGPIATNVSFRGNTGGFGQTLSGNYTYNDPDGDIQGVSTFRWLRDGVAINGATSLTYTTVSADAETTIQFEVTPVAVSGVTTGLAVKSSGRFISAMLFDWAKKTGSSEQEDGYDVAVDSNGNSYITGYFNGTVDFDPGAGTSNLTSAGQSDIFVLKLDSSGNFVWAKRMGGSLADEGRSIKVDSSGNSYITGLFNGTADFDPGAGTSNLTSAGYQNTFILKLNSSGNFVWVKQITGNDSVGYDINLDTNGNMYILGSFSTNADFDPGAGTFILTSGSTGILDGFILKLDSSGNFVWVKRLDGSSMTNPQRSFIDSGDNNIYLVGFFDGTVDFDPGAGTSNLTSAGQSDGFILKLDSSGNFVWVKNFGSTSSDVFRSVFIDNNNVYVSGYFNGTVDFDPGAGTSNLTSAGQSDIFVLKLDSSGNFVWANNIGGTGSDAVMDINIDSHGSIYLSGYFNGTVDFDPGAGTSNLTSAGQSDGFILKLDSSRNFVFLKRIGGNEADSVNSFKFDSNYNIIATGRFRNSIDLGNINLTSVGQSDIFVTKIVPYVYIDAVPVVSSVTISGTPNIAQTLTGSYTYTDADDDTEGTSTFRWLRDDVAIDGATSLTYTTVLGDVGHTLKFEVTPVAATGETPGIAVVSSGTSIVPIVPTLTTSSATNTTKTTTTLNGSITNIGGELLTERGFNYGLTESYGTTVSDTGSYDTGTYAKNITELNCGTTYHYRSYGTNTAGTSYGDDVIFNTIRCPSTGYSSPTRTVITTPTINPNTPNPTPSNTNKVTPAVTITRTIKPNTTSPEIKSIQEYLNTHGYTITTTGPGSPGKETTKYGPLTKKAIMKFQRDNKLTPDGIIGPKTRALMK